jgi:hypothetical protein
MRSLKYLVVVTSIAVGALFAVGFLLAALFEVQGFGGPRDQPPRTGYVLELAVGFVACVAIPTLLARQLVQAGPGWITAGTIAVAGALAILGLSLG